jgi:tetratricopeptide (TPR) repeat protein
MERGDQDAALADSLQAVRRAPQNALAWNVLGIVRVRRCEYPEALEAFDTAGRYGALTPQALYNKAFALLAMGRVAEGWDHYEVGVHAQTRNAWRRTTRPMWEGEPLAGRSICIVAEQGIGDQLLFLSCLPDFLERIGPDVRVVLEVNPKLASLVQRSFPAVEVRAAERTAARNRIQDFDDTDTCILLGSLPRFVRRSIDDFPQSHAAFLVADPERVVHWRQHFAERSPDRPVGLCWRSMLLQTARNLHYLSLEEMAPVFDLPGVQCVGLQYGDARAELAAVEARWPGRVLSLEEAVDLTDDLDEVAAVIAALDAVVAPSTTVSTLANALAVPVYEFSRFNWERLGTERKPFCPSIRCFDRPREEPIVACIPDIREALIRDLDLSAGEPR